MGVSPAVAATSNPDPCGAPYYAEKIGLYEGEFTWLKGVDANGLPIEALDPDDDFVPRIGYCEFTARMEILGGSGSAGTCPLTARLVSSAAQLIVPDGGTTSFNHECIGDDVVLELIDPFFQSAAGSPPEPGVDFTGPLAMPYRLRSEEVPSRGPDVDGDTGPTRISLFSTDSASALVTSLGFVTDGSGRIVPLGEIPARNFGSMLEGAFLPVLSFDDP